MNTVVKFKARNSKFVLPKQELEGSSGFDLRYYGEEDVTLSELGDVAILDLGFSMELEPGYEAQIRPRSGWAAKHGLTILNAPGTIDCHFSGVVKAIMVRSGNLPVKTIEPGDRVCQMVIQKVPMVKVELVDSLTDTERGEGGFGSTGIK